MEAGLAARHPEIRTFRGVGVSDPYATVRLSFTPLGLSASVRAPLGAWYIDTYYQQDDSLYASYYGRDLTEHQHGPLFDRDSSSSELSFGQAYYHAADPVTLTGTGFAANSQVTITISDPLEQFPVRTLGASTDELGSFQVEFTADPDGNLDVHVVEVTDGTDTALGSYQVIRDDDPTVDPPTGDLLRTYRLALITDPGYATFFGGSANVTAAKVQLMNRVNQIYEDDMSIRMVLVNNNDLLNFDTWAQAIAPNSACGAAGCFTQAQVTGCSSTSRARYVIGQIIGASNYDIGHLALGQPGGGVANLGVVGRSNKAGGCTGIPTPTGDFYAVDYVAHEMGHQFSGNHPFNGNQLNCSGGNRSGATSVEPGSGSSVMAYAGICLTDDLQAHSDPYFSQRSQQEISTYTSSNQAAINEVQTASLQHFGGGNEVQVVTFGPGFLPGCHRPAAEPGDQRRAERCFPGRGNGGRQYRHHRHRECPYPAGWRYGHDRRRGRGRLQRHVPGHRSTHLAFLPIYESNVGSGEIRRWHGHPGRTGRHAVRHHRHDQHLAPAWTLGGGCGHDLGCGCRRVQRHLRRSPQCPRRALSNIRRRPPGLPTRALARPRSSRPSRCGPAAMIRR